jgi:lipopolysaccharide/colanic/teichoic acid biosynthesis glycosyltransferase
MNFPTLINVLRGDLSIIGATCSSQNVAEQSQAWNNRMGEVYHDQGTAA